MTGSALTQLLTIALAAIRTGVSGPTEITPQTITSRACMSGSVVRASARSLTEQPTPELSCASVPCLSHCQAQLRIIRRVRAMKPLWPYRDLCCVGRQAELERLKHAAKIGIRTGFARSYLFRWTRII